ncbi:MAG TPA: PD-(D/E)XK nuclease-like domain-containing protein [Stellaceae bacterium]|jgi:hypothetical protein|nr:PD-(D/E)XK nuclease-like domain-containing protein [Stellaceae bacterium]
MSANVVRDMPEAEYHATKALSAGGAWSLANDCPAIYWHSSPFNPDAAPAENAKVMDIGTALHLAVLEPDRLQERTVLVEAEDWRTKAAKEARDAAYEAGLTPLLLKDRDLVDRLANVLRRNEYVARLLDGADTEISYFWDAGGVGGKARADLVTKDCSAIGDLKASASASPLFFQRRAFNAGHFLRTPWYVDGWEASTGKRAEYWYIVVGCEEPHLVSVLQLDQKAVEWGRMMIRRSLDLFRRCRDRGVWPGYCDRPMRIGLPTWAEYQLADREQEGHFRDGDPSLLALGAELYKPMESHHA